MSNFKITTSMMKPKRILKSLSLYLETLIGPPGIREMVISIRF